MKKEINRLKRKYFGIEGLIEAYRAGENITRLYRNIRGEDFNSDEIIEVAYDLQAGSDVKEVLADMEQNLAYAGELAEVLDSFSEPGDTLMDIGTGELTTISLVIKQMNCAPQKIFAFDISWSRVWKGLQFAREQLNQSFNDLVPFVANINDIPLQNKSVDVVTSSHALEPNGGNERALLIEIFRVARKFAILFEPSYEMNTVAGQKRMRDHGYIKGLTQVIQELGGSLVEVLRIKNISNPLNPTYGYVIKPPVVQAENQSSIASDVFASPINKKPLLNLGEIFLSETEGLCFPVIKGVPILRADAAILTSALCK